MKWSVLLLLLISGMLYAAGDAIKNEAFQKGLKFYSEKKFLLAIGSFKASIDGGFQDARAYFFLANAYVNNEDYDKAFDNYKLAQELAEKPELQAIITHNIGYVYYLKKDYPKAIEFFNKAYESDKKLDQTFWFKGMAYYRLRDKKDTISEWEQYLNVAPAGKESDNIRRALAILKDPDFDFDKNKLFSSDNTNGGASSSAEKPEPKVEPLIDIEGVLEEVKPADKGKVSDQSLEDIER